MHPPGRRGAASRESEPKAAHQPATDTMAADRSVLYVKKMNRRDPTGTCSICIYDKRVQRFERAEFQCHVWGDCLSNKCR